MELAGVYSTVESDAAHFQVSSTQLDPIPEAFNVKRSIPVYSKLNSMEGIYLGLFRSILGKVGQVILDLNRVHTTLNGTLFIVPGLFWVYSGSIP